MSGLSDPRRVVGANVNTLASAVTNYAECRRLYGSNARTKRINGIVRRVNVTRPLSGRCSTTLEVIWSLTVNRTKITTLKLNRIKPVTVESAQIAQMSQNETVSESQEHIQRVNNTIVPNTNYSSSFVVNDAAWLREEVYSPIRGAIQRQI